MTHKLIQKSLLGGTQEYELRDDAIRVKISKPFKKNKELDVVLAMLNPEPVIDKSQLHFHSRVKCGPLISLYINNPSEKEFNAFVEAVKTKAEHEFNSFSGINNL